MTPSRFCGCVQTYVQKAGTLPLVIGDDSLNKNPHLLIVPYHINISFDLFLSDTPSYRIIVRLEYRMILNLMCG
jgi:hypothetical protein